MDKLNSMLNRFVCNKDQDIEHFLKDKAIEFLENKLASTYLIMYEENINNGNYEIEGYFALSTKALACSNLSKSLAKKFGHGRIHEAESFILIAQLGKYIGQDKISDINLDIILDLINDAVVGILEYLPYRFMIVECNDAVFNKGIYQSRGFKVINESNPDGLHQLYKPT